MIGIIYIGHGSRNRQPIKDFEDLVLKCAQQVHPIPVSYGFLEHASPNVEHAIDVLYRKGVRFIKAIPIFLFSGTHILSDIPQLLDEIQQKYDGLEIEFLEYLGLRSGFKILLVNALTNLLRNCDCEKSLLVTVGVGTSISDANRPFYEMGELVASHFRFGAIESCFLSRVAKPRLQEQISIIGESQFSSIVIVPFLLFKGIYYSEIEASAAHLIAQYNKTVLVSLPFAYQPSFHDLIIIE